MAMEFGLSRETVRKMLEYAVPPGYRRQQPIRRPKLGPWIGVIDAILDDDKQRPPKQRHTAKRIFDRLREEHQFTGGYTVVKDYIRSATQRGREMFVPLTHPVGRGAGGLRRSAGGDCRGAAEGALPGHGTPPQRRRTVAGDPGLPHSDDCFVQAFPAETRKLSWKAMCRPLLTSAACPRGYSMTTRRLRWLGS